MYAKDKESGIAQMVIKPNKIVHQICTLFVPKRGEIGIEYGAFLGALILIMVTKFFSNSTIRSCIFGNNYFKYGAKFASNIIQICLLQKIFENKEQDMHKFCFVREKDQQYAIALFAH